MHFKNGRPAQEGDPVVFRRWNGRVTVGVLHTINPQATTCNGQVAVALPGGVSHESANVSDLYHAEDALFALEYAQANRTPQRVPENVVELPPPAAA